MRWLRSAKRWFQADRFLDAFFAYCQEGWTGYRRVVNEIVTFRRAAKLPKTKLDFRPQIEPLEVRLVPTTVQVSPSNYLVPETSGVATITVALDAPAVNDVSVHYETGPGTYASILARRFSC